MFLTFFTNKYTKTLTAEQFSIDDIFAGRTLDDIEIDLPVRNTFNTKTVIVNNAPKNTDMQLLTTILNTLKELAKPFKNQDLNNLYKTFYIPKRSGGLRQIDAPKDELMIALKNMKNIFQYQLKVLYHNAAYAYVPNKNIKNALQVHQKNNSKWFLKLDIKNFFPNCSQEFVVKMLRKIYPFALWSEEDIKSFIWICFKNNSLPQGTPMSPMLTNLIMIPIDYLLQNYAFKNNLVYTRYADDILISSKKSFNVTEVVKKVNDAFATQKAPFKINNEKTRYGSSAGRNWNLGLMLNKDNNITVGYRNKKNYKAMLNNLLIAEVSGSFWDTDEIYHFQGITSYYLSIEPVYFRNLISKYEQMYNLTLKEIYKRTL